MDKEKELRKNCSLAYDKFLLDHRLEDIYKTVEVHPHFCHYECSPIFLMESLVNSMEILPTDYILDIGCGTGIFLFFLASKKFLHLYGIEYNEKLIPIALKNQSNWTNKYKIDITFQHINALMYSIPREMNIFYFFNTFLNKGTYIEWLELLKNSLLQHPRKIKIILLLPTEESMSAFLSCSFLHKKCNLKDARQCNSEMLYYTIFTN